VVDHCDGTFRMAGPGFIGKIYDGPPALYGRAPEWGTSDPAYFRYCRRCSRSLPIS